MRIVIDMQGAQTESRFRGIGRYSLSFAQSIVRNRGEHEIILALSGLFPDTIEPIRSTFDGMLPQENIRVWHAPGPVREVAPGNDRLRETAELIREAFLVSLQPDVIHVSSLFEGFVDDAVTSIGRFDQVTPVSVSLYDLIPLLNPEHYLKPNPAYEQYYLRKVNYLRRAATCLAISDFSRKEGIDTLGMVGERIFNVSTATVGFFRPHTVVEAAAIAFLEKYGITRPFVLYTGGSDERKNLPRLIEAFAALPASLRDRHQLVFAGKMPESDVARFRHLARSGGMRLDELIFTGYITDEEIVQFYNLCQLFVFPSWHEGFGLPALEAMACGAPTIGGNTTSLPEVIGLDEALFDPFDASAISKKMAQALEEEAFRSRLREYGLQQAKLFSWDETAKRAIAAWELLPSRPHSAFAYLDQSLAHSRLIGALAQQVSARDEVMLSSLAACLAQNQGAGIERQLLLDVSELSQRDSATGVQRVVRSYLKWLLQSPPSGFRVEPVYATLHKGYCYARGFTQRFLGQNAAGVTDEPVQWQRGDIFFGLDMQHHVQLAQMEFYQRLRSEGVAVKFLVYDLLPIQLADMFKDSNAKELHERWLNMIAATDGAICISKATADALEEWITQSGVTPAPNFRTDWVHIGGDINGSQPSTGLPPDAQETLSKIRSRPSFLCVSTLEPRKGQRQILDAIQQLWAEGRDVNLVLVGRQGWKTETLAEALRQHPEQGHRLFWLQGISDEYLEQVYGASACLIAASINEGFGLPLIEAARHAVPIVARDIPVFREVAGDCAYYFNGDEPADIATALKTWIKLHQDGRVPQSCKLNWTAWQQSTENLKVALVQENYPRRQLLVDISELVQRDARSGIQRVVRSILKEWLNNPPLGYRIEPVYATAVQGYRYARLFTQKFMGSNFSHLTDDFIEFSPGDVFLGLDLAPAVVPAHRSFYQVMRRHGVIVKFVIYDLQPLIPQYFEQVHADAFSRWLEVAVESDGAVCISKAVRRELSDWLANHAYPRSRIFTIEWFHLGADIKSSTPTYGIPADAALLLERLRGRKNFLMVSTLAPHKGHSQVIDAFDLLWEEDLDANLVIVGNRGWCIDRLIERLLSHPKLNSRLFWLEGVSDEYLEKIYSLSTCIISASYCEGFGLPLIEAAQHGLPIIARDIPVFREVAGPHAFYFSAESSDELANAINNWLSIFYASKFPMSDGISWLTWRESAAFLLSALRINSFVPPVRGGERMPLKTISKA